MGSEAIMLQFYSSQTRMVNSQHAIAECLAEILEKSSGKCDLILIHASLGHDLKVLSEAAMQRVPQARVLAASCCGVVGREGVSESLKDVAVMAITGEEFAVAHTDGIFGDNSYECSARLAEQLKRQAPGINMVYFMASGIDIANDRCIEGLESVLGSATTVFGATSSDNMRGIVSYQACNGVVTEHGAFAIGFADPSLTVDTQASHGFLAVGEPLLVTRSKGHLIFELNGKPAWKEFTSRLGLPDSATCGETIPVGALAERLSPALAAEYGNDHILRVVTKRDQGVMYYATTCPEGTSLWLTRRDEERIFSDMDRMMASLSRRANGRHPVAVFHADCLARGRYLFQRVLKEELVSRMQYPFYREGQCPPWLGMYGFGEFARLGGRNMFHNYTTALYALYRTP